MVELRSVLEEWKGVPASLEIATDTSSSTSHEFSVPGGCASPT